MKFLLAFALFAVASAVPEPVRLLEPVLVEQEAAYAPLDLPQGEVYQTVKVVNAVETADGVVEQADDAEASAFAVHFVEEAVNEAPAAVEAEDVSAFAVKFVDEAVNAEAPAEVASEDVSAFAVKFVDEAVNEAPAAVEAEDVSTFAVKFVEEAVNAEAPAAADAGEITYTNYVVQHIEEAANEETGAPFSVRIVQLPLPGSVVLPLDAMMPLIEPAMVDGPVQMTFDYQGHGDVKVAETNEEIPAYPKRYPDPTWR